MLYIKALHIIFVVSWFAGLFYIVRLFIYDVEAGDRPENEKNILQTQLRIMQKKLWYIITWPAMILTLVFGIWMWSYYNFSAFEWMMSKLFFVGILIGYHIICHRLFKKLQDNKPIWDSTKLRLWNELATLLLVAIVFIVVCKNSLDGTIGLLWFIGITIVLFAAVRIYKKFRVKS